MSKIAEIKAQLTAVTQMLHWANNPKVQCCGKDTGSTDIKKTI